jgi:microcystin-dependent protein
MSDYTKLTSYDTKDALSTGDPLKRVKGTELDDEFDAIATAIATKANSASPAFTGTPTGPTATAGTNTTQLATTAFVNALFPAGIIAMWSGVISNIPTGWYLCNGSNGTPDLRNKFIIGAYLDDTVAKTTVTGSNTQTGGTKDAVNVEHTHTATDSGHTHTYPRPVNSGGFLGGTSSFSIGSTGTTDSSTANITVASAGVSGTNQNLPPYFALAFIMKA